MAKKKRVVLEVEGGFIAKEYDSKGSVVAKSAVVASEDEAKKADLVELGASEEEGE